MQHHDPHMQNHEGTLTRDATPRRDQDEADPREQPGDRFAAGTRDPSSGHSTGGTRKYYEF